MYYIIDGYNFLFHIRSHIHDLASHRKEVISTLASLLASMHATVVFDSAYPHADDYPTRFNEEGVEVIFSPDGSSADAYIIELTSYHRNPADVTVVTSDTHLTRHIKEFGCRSMPIDTFIQQALLRQKKQTPKGKIERAESAREIARLEALFTERLKKAPEHDL